MNNSQKSRAESQKIAHAYRTEQILTREAQRYRLQSRKATREVLQYVSSQTLSKFSNKELAHELATCNPAMVAEFTMEQSLRYKDPAKIDISIMPSNCRYCFQDCTTKQLKGLIRPFILEKDKGNIEIT